MTSGLSASSYQSVFDKIITSDPKDQNKVPRKDIAKSKKILQKTKKDIAKNKRDIAKKKKKPKAEKSQKINKQESPAKFSISFTLPLPHVFFFHGRNANSSQCKVLLF